MDALDTATARLKFAINCLADDKIGKPCPARGIISIMKTNWLQKYLLAGIAPLLVGAGLSAAPLTWFPGPAIDTPMSGAASVVTGGKNLLTGGDAYASYFFPVSYPISLAATNTYWTYLSPFYSLNIAPGAVVSDGNVIIYGGSDGTSSQSAAFAYSLSGDTTPTMPSMNVARSYLGYAADKNGNAYAFGGLDANGNPLSSAERFSLANNNPTWTYIASLPGARYNFPAVFDRTNFIYIFGGLTDTIPGIESATVLRYSVNGNSWSNMTSMPVAVAGSAATLGPDGKIYVVGGTSGGISTNVVQVYNPVANSWTISTPLPEGLSLAAMGVDSLGRLIVMGGVDTNGNDVGDVWRSQQFGVADSAPAFTQYPGTSATYLASYTSSINATGSPPPTYSLVSGPAGMQVDYYSGVITWTPQGLGQIGTNSVTIQAANFSGSTNWTFTITVPNPPPTVPTNLTVIAMTENSVTLSWDPESPVVGPVNYSVYLRHVLHDPKGSGATIWYTQIGSTTSLTTITITGLAAGLAQAYYVVATGAGGTSGYAGIVATTLAAPTPTNLRVTGLTSTTITLAWDAPTGGIPVVSYEVLGWFNGIAAQYPLAYPNINGTTLTITSLASGTAMLWGVSAHDTAGNVSGYDYLPSLVINPVPKPAALAAVVAPPVTGGFQFTVQASAVQTTLIQATTNLVDPTSWVIIATNPPGNAFIFTDTNATLFPTRYYRVVSP
jgi:hypothetical protein